MSDASSHGSPASAADEAASAPRRRDAAEEARTLVQRAPVGALATLSDDGGPWSSLVVQGPTPSGDPVLLVSTMAEHGRNLARDPRASISIADPDHPGDPLDGARITLAGRAVAPAPADAAEAALDAHVAAVPGARLYAGWDDFHLYVLWVERVRWIGGFARMETIDVDAYRAAAPDPIAPVAARSVAHLNRDHADALLSMARELAGARGAVSAVCTGIDRYGIDLSVTGAGQSAAARVGFPQPLTAAEQVRPATVELARRARAARDAARA